MKVLILLSVAAIAAAHSYSGYSVYTLRPQTEKQLAWLNDIRQELNLDFWTEPRGVGQSIDVLISPELKRKLLPAIFAEHIQAQIKIRNVQSLIDAQKNPKKMPKVTHKKSLRLDHTEYRNLEDIYAALDDFAANSDYVSLYEPTQTTSEGRNFKIAKVSSDGSDTKPVIWIDCGIHAREWVSSATCQYLIDVLTSGDADGEALLETHDFHILTLTNPDGYAYTWTGQRLWRKNRHQYDLCVGTDPNRNFDSDFGGPGTSDSPCSDIYHGESAFSEPESQAVRDSLLALGDRVKAYITLHAYSQLWMTPYGYTHDLPANYDEQYRVSGIGAKALEAVHGTSFTYGNIADVIYMAAGGSSDWAYDSASIQYAFALELRDTGSYGFLLPPEQIVPVGEEVLQGLKAAIDAMQ